MIFPLLSLSLSLSLSPIVSTTPVAAVVTKEYTLKIAIVDDDKKVYEHLLVLLSELLDCPSGIVFFPNGEQFLSAWEKGA